MITPEQMALAAALREILGSIASKDADRLYEAIRASSSLLVTLETVNKLGASNVKPQGTRELSAALIRAASHVRFGGSVEGMVVWGPLLEGMEHEPGDLGVIGRYFTGRGELVVFP